MLAVNEIYGPVQQGEGKSAGKDVIFLRLSGCNLACDWCDTPYTWNWKGTKFVHPEKYDPKDEVKKMTTDEVKSKVQEYAAGVKALVISGGEPMLQQASLLPLLREFGKDSWWVEVETNGTIEPEDEFIRLISQFNCSPKTSNSGPDNPEKKRLDILALRKIAQQRDKSTFKFVIQSINDAVEVRDIIQLANIKPEQVWIMPEGKTKEEQLAREGDARLLARSNGYNFSPRLHVLQFGNKRAV